MKTTNLIQSYITNNQNTQQYNSDKVAKNFNVQKELTNRTFIKPLPSNGKLLKPTIFDYPADLKNDIIYDVKALGHAISGKANDHELGRLNDVALKTGGLAIASYLFTRKTAPSAKMFEFLGLGTFLASMTLWPKLFIQLPAKLIHGVDVRQQYEDNYGRKKMFYQDHQFIPWDLYSDEEIDKIGNRLGVPKNINNRRDFIQEKMRKIALQNNTLWMLTAGFATPIMSSLLCNALEKPMVSYLDKMTAKKADNLLNKFDDNVKGYNFSNQTNELRAILSANSGKPVTPELVKQISDNLGQGLTRPIAKSIERDIADLLPTGKTFTLNDEQLCGVQKAISDAFSPLKLGEEELGKLVPNIDTLRTRLSSSNLLNSDFSDFSEHSKTIQKLLNENIREITGGDKNHPLARKLEFYKKQLIHSIVNEADSPLVASFKQKQATILTPNLVEVLKSVSSDIAKFKAQSLVLDKYAYLKVGQAPETNLANAWNKAQDLIFKSMNFTPEEIKNARIDGEISTSIFRNKLEAITSDNEAYSKFVKTIEQAIKIINDSATDLDTSQANNLFRSKVETCYDSIGNSMEKAGLRRTKEALVGFTDNGNPVAGTSAKQLMFEFVNNRLLGVKSSFLRLLSVADMYHRISTLENIDIVKHYPREIQEEMIELAKTTLIDGHSSDFAVKFWQLRNPDPKSSSDKLEVKGGKVVNQFLGTHGASEVSELSNDSGYFQSVMRLMFGEDVNRATVENISNGTILDELRDYRRKVLEVVGNDEYFPKPKFLATGHKVESTSDYRFLLMGSTPTDMASKYFNNAFNSGKWLNMFGKFGIALAGVTILSQFFFGKMKNPKPEKGVK